MKMKIFHKTTNITLTLNIIWVKAHQVITLCKFSLLNTAMEEWRVLLIMDKPYWAFSPIKTM